MISENLDAIKKISFLTGILFLLALAARPQDSPSFHKNSIGLSLPSCSLLISGSPMNTKSIPRMA